MSINLVPPWRDTYYGIKQGEYGKSPLDIFIELRAKEILFELSIMAEQALPLPQQWERRKARLNPGLRDITTII